MKKNYDLSIKLSEKTEVFEGDESFKKIELAKIDTDGFRTDFISMTTHVGTHIDSPAHFFKNGKTLDQYSPDRFYGRVHVINSKRLISYIHNILEEDSLIFSDDKPIEFTDETLNHLKNKKIKMIGTKGLSIEFSPPFKLHQFFLSNDILLLENLNLDEVPEGIYFLVALPILIENSDAAPTRVFLFDDFL
jgi:arylformamidase